MFIALAIVFPALVLLAILGMERVERPLDQYEVRTELERFLASDGANGQPERIEQFVADGYRITLKRYWRHHERSRNKSQTRASQTAHERRPDVSGTTAVPLALGQTEGGTHVAGA